MEQSQTKVPKPQERNSLMLAHVPEIPDLPEEPVKSALVEVAVLFPPQPGHLRTPDHPSKGKKERMECLGKSGNESRILGEPQERCFPNPSSKIGSMPVGKQRDCIFYRYSMNILSILDHGVKYTLSQYGEIAKERQLLDNVCQRKTRSVRRVETWHVALNVALGHKNAIAARKILENVNRLKNLRLFRQLSNDRTLTGSKFHE